MDQIDMKKKRNKFPNRKISETFLDFAPPIMDALGENPTKYQVEQALKIAFTVWNSIILDTVRGSSEYLSMLRETMQEDPISSALIEQMIFRKNNIFSDDHRMIGEYRITKINDEWRLRAEARDPSATV
jgi:hypothetical protein